MKCPECDSRIELGSGDSNEFVCVDCGCPITIQVSKGSDTAKRETVKKFEEPDRILSPRNSSRPREAAKVPRVLEDAEDQDENFFESPLNAVMGIGVMVLGFLLWVGVGVGVFFFVRELLEVTISWACEVLTPWGGDENHGGGGYEIGSRNNLDRGGLNIAAFFITLSTMTGGSVGAFGCGGKLLNKLNMRN